MLSVPDFYSPLSLRLSRILDEIGASEKIRKLATDTAITREIALFCLIDKQFGRKYIFGSTAEGTKTPGLQSDTDYLVCFDSPEIFQSVSDIPLQRDQGDRLLVKDKTTKPGYCKLQPIIDQIPLTLSYLQMLDIPVPNRCELDSSGRVIQAFEPPIECHSEHTIHGPAIASPASSLVHAKDHVPAYRCRAWPKAASKWLDRERRYGWPSEDLIEKMKTLGFFVVRVGHAHSSERHLEWRISLSLQERLLMFNLNPTQYKCYILLKMVKKTVINKKLEVEAISSYYCKTCLFYMIENTPADFWQPKNLLACLQGCMKCIHRWVKSFYCPNYFIPEENMFEGRLDDNLRTKLENVLEILLTGDCYFLLAIQSDDVARRIKTNVFPVSLKPESDYVEPAARMSFEMYLNIWAIGDSANKQMLYQVKKLITPDGIGEIFGYITDLAHATYVPGYTTARLRKAANAIIPYLEMSLIPLMVANKVEEGEIVTALDLLLSSKWRELNFSMRLKQVTFLYMLGQYEVCTEVITALGNMRPSMQVSHCTCRLRRISVCTEVIRKMKYLSFDEVRKSYFVSCCIFSPSEKMLIPTPMAYEMLRSVHMPTATPGYRISDESLFHQDWAMVDSQFYLYFLCFLLYRATQTPGSMAWIEYMELRLEKDLIHTETAMNLIGWCYKQEGDIQKAIEYFYGSLSVQLNHNAAFWHVLFTICELTSGNGQKENS